jgi:hypothetical protein
VAAAAVVAGGVSCVSTLFCLTCGEAHHTACVFPPDGSAVALKDLHAGYVACARMRLPGSSRSPGIVRWRCMACLTCERCDLSAPEASLLVCDACERGYHMGCLDPPLAVVPPGRWQCPQCVRCVQCGGRLGPWARDDSVCQRCADAATAVCSACALPVPPVLTTTVRRPASVIGRPDPLTFML